MVSNNRLVVFGIYVHLILFENINFFSAAALIYLHCLQKGGDYRQGNGCTVGTYIGRVVESLQSHCIHTMSHWSSGLPVCFLSWGTQVQSPGGYLSETGLILLALSHYIGDQDMIDHCGLVWGGLRPEPSLGRRAYNVIIPLDLTQLFYPGFTKTRCRFSFQLHNQHGQLLGGSPVESPQSHCIHTMSHWSSGLPVCFLSWGTWVQSPRG